MDASFEFLEHTADVKFRAYGRSREEVFANAGRALAAAITDVSRVEAVDDRVVACAADDDETLLHDFLSELLFLFEDEGFLYSGISVELDGDALSAKLCGELFQPDKHVLHGEVKAVTYHDMSIGDTGDGWEATVLCDT